MASSKGVTFAGAYIVKPGVYTDVDTTAMVPNRSNVDNVIGYIGPADGGIPGKVYEFASFDEAKAVVKGGPVLSYMSRMFSPSPDRPGANLIRYIRPGSATKATYAINASLTLTSLDSGRSANGILWSLDAGADDAVLKSRTSGGVDSTFKVRTATIERPLAGYKRTQTLRHGLNLTCSVSVTDTNKNTIVRDADAATGTFYLVENGTIVDTMPFVETTTVKEVAAWINARSAWKAVVIGDYDMPAACLQFALGSGTPADATYEQNGIPVNTTASLHAAAGVGALAYMLNAYDAQVEAAVTSFTNTLPVGATVQAAFTGGTGSGLDTMTSDDVTDALAILSTVNVQHVFLQSMDPALQQLVYNHVQTMRTVKSKKYRIFYGGFNAYPATKDGENYTPVKASNADGVPLLSGESWVDKYLEQIRALDGPVVLAANGDITANPVTGLPEQLYGLGLAAQMCGMAAGDYAVEPLTNKAVKSQGLQYPVISDSDIDRILEGGGSIAVYSSETNRTVILQALTTYQGGANVMFRKLQGLRIQDEINKGFQVALSPFAGFPMDLRTGTLIQQECAKFLDRSIRSGSNPGGFLTPGMVDGATVPAWTNLKVIGDGIDAWSISVEAHPVGETAYILVTTKLTPVAINL